MSVRIVRILSSFVLVLQAMMALASADGWLLCTHTDGVAHVDRYAADGQCETTSNRSADVPACSGRDVPLDSQNAKPGVQYFPSERLLAVDWTAALPFVLTIPRPACGPATDPITPPPPVTARAGVVLLT